MPWLWTIELLSRTKHAHKHVIANIPGRVLQQQRRRRRRFRRRSTSHKATTGDLSNNIISLQRARIMLLCAHGYVPASLLIITMLSGNSVIMNSLNRDGLNISSPGGRRLLTVHKLPQDNELFRQTRGSFRI